MKITEYPRASLRSALQLADAVDSFAGSCSSEMAAEKLGKKLSGSFSALIGACVKFRLIANKSGKLAVTPIYREYKLAYTPDEAAVHLRNAFLSPPLFKAIHDRFKDQRLPVQHFEKLLIREFGVPATIASRIVIYFLDGAKQCGLLGNDNLLLNESEERIEESDEVDVVGKEMDERVSDIASTNNTSNEASREPGPYRAVDAIPIKTGGNFDVTFKGPGVNISIEIAELDDLDVVNVMLKKIEKALRQREEA